MAAIKMYQIFLLYGCIVLALSVNKNDILYDDANDALLQKYLYYLQEAPQKWEEYYEDETDGDDESTVSAYDAYEQFLSASDDEDEGFDEEVIPEQGGFEVNLRMPQVRPLEDDTYLCHVMPMPKDIPVYIVGYEPHADSHTAHHILLFGCKLPGDFDPVWNCGEMAGSGARPVCMGQQNILYAWALDAPALELPKDVGFKVGGDSDIDYLVLQVHYKTAAPFEDGSSDNSGITMHMTLERQRLVAGVYFMGADGKIPGHSQVNLEGACQYEEKPTLHPFAFRVHTHTLGKVVSAYRIRDDEWEEIGKRDPQLPEMFYPVADEEMTIDKGDILAMRCTMNSDRDTTTYIGSTQADEMCNFYMMYYTEHDDLPRENSCYVFDFYWSEYLKNIPDKAASMLPENQPGSEMKMDMGMDVNEPVVEEVIVPPKAQPDEEEEEQPEEDEGENRDVRVEEEIEVEENQGEDPDPRK
ncbi:peptidylglycine alpha-hydroxylating monooxygenase-like [Amphiura filiformis]|uniref:peptidylglycine alpha-hydroxylating monooxygenase-like n=1 Tax=Amphiura filiformis TaxID=82378 RepID=UPI003B20CF1D